MSQSNLNSLKSLKYLFAFSSLQRHYHSHLSRTYWSLAEIYVKTCSLNLDFFNLTIFGLCLFIIAKSVVLSSTHKSIMMGFSRDLTGNCLNCTNVMSHVSSQSSLTWSCYSSQYHNDCTTGLCQQIEFIFTHFDIGPSSQSMQNAKWLSLLWLESSMQFFLSQSWAHSLFPQSHFSHMMTLSLSSQQLYCCKTSLRREFQPTLLTSHLHCILIHTRLYSDVSFSLKEKTNFSITVTAFSMRICW